MKKPILAICLCLTLLTGCATTGRHEMEPSAAMRPAAEDSTDRPADPRPQPIRKAARRAADAVIAPVALLVVFVFYHP